MAQSEQIEVENINTPGRTERVNAAKYHNMRSAILSVLPDQSPGLTHAEMIESVKGYLDATLFPEGKTSGWWSKCVQLDLEAKGIIVREKTKPLRWYKVTA